MLPISSLPAADARALKWVLFDIDDTVTNSGRLTAAAYSAMWSLADAGLSLIPVTGRPAGWCDLIVREWPVAAVVGENGAFALRLESGRVKTILHPLASCDPAPALLALQKDVLRAFPHARLAHDQFARIHDVAFDFAEDEPRLPLSFAREVAAFCREHGAQAKVSSIHVNAWFGCYDKVSMSERLLRDTFGESDPFASSVFFGDSPNDEPMFARFPLSCGVENVLDMADELASMPAYIAPGRGGFGFAAAAAELLAKRS